MSRNARLDRMRQWLVVGRGFTAAQAQRELEVSLSTVKRDVAYLRDNYDMPAVWDAECGAWRLDRSSSDQGATFEMPGLWLSAQEIHALLTMQQLLSGLDAGVLLGEQIAPLMKRIGRILGSGLPAPEEVARRIRVLTMGARRLNLPHFEAVASALLRRRRLQVRYHARGGDRISDRALSPQRLVHYRDNWYLDAWCHWRQALRSFSVDAIASVTVLDEAALEVPDAELDEALGAGYGIVAGGPMRQAVLRFSPRRALGGAERGLRGRAGGLDDAGGRTRPPHAATRHLETALGVLSCAELAPHLARRVEATQLAVYEGALDAQPPSEELLRELHSLIGGDLTPAIAGRWRRADVAVGSHKPTAAHRVPPRTRDYVHDRGARLAHLPAEPDGLRLEAPAFAERRLLGIHPFADFNGRVTRVFIGWLARHLRLPDIDPMPVRRGRPDPARMPPARSA